MKPVKFNCTDGVILKGKLFEPSSIRPKGIIQINGATAVVKEFYVSFARYLVENGWIVLIYDYRGIGESKPENGLKNCDYEYLDWGKQDINAAFEFVQEKYPDLKKILLGHSVGGQLAGFLKKQESIAGMLTISTSSGYWRNMPLKNRLKTLLFFEIIRPISHALFGYTALKKLGLMEDLPKNITNKWRDWCNVPDYFFNEKYRKEALSEAYFEKMGFPIKVIYPIDDYIATDENVNLFWKNVHSKNGLNIEKVSPNSLGLKEIGHFGFFQRKNQKELWPLILENLEKF